MAHAERVRDLTELRQVRLFKVELPADLEADGVDDEVGVDVHGIVVTQLAQVMNQQHGNAVPVCQCFEYTDVPIVVGVGIGIVAHGPDALQGVDDHEARGRMLLEELLNLFHQSAVELFRHGGEVQCGRRVLW